MKKFKYLILICFIVLSLFAGYSYSKYRYSVSQVNLSEPETFVFVSNYEEGQNYYVFMDGASTNINVKVSNNDLGLFSVSDIDFKVSMKNLSTDEVTTSSTYTLEGNENSSQEVPLTIAVDTNYEVTVESQKPFNKKINFTIQGVNQNKITSRYELVNHGNWIQIDLYMGNVVKDVTINYGDYAPDNTNDLMMDWLTTSGTGTISDENLNAYSQYTLIFFGTYDTVDVSKTFDDQYVIDITHQ